MRRACLGATALAALGLPALAQERPTLDLEWGSAWAQRNSVQSPNDAGGTRFALDALTGSGPTAAPRLQLHWPLNTRDDLRLVVAPLRVHETGRLAQAVNFEGESFAVGPTSATYRFDSYRLSWRRTVHEDPQWVVKAGFTGKIRSAEISLRQGSTSASRTDLGLVPLLHLHAQRRLGERSRLVFEGDGLTSSRGRAFDLSLRYAHDLRPGLAAFAGLRLLDGGADNEKVYNFARFTYLSVGLSYSGF